MKKTMRLVAMVIAICVSMMVSAPVMAGDDVLYWKNSGDHELKITQHLDVEEIPLSRNSETSWNRTHDEKPERFVSYAVENGNIVCTRTTIRVTVTEKWTVGIPRKKVFTYTTTGVDKYELSLEDICTGDVELL